MQRYLLRTLSGLAAAVLLAACSDTTGPERVDTVRVTASSDSVAASTTLGLSAELRDADGNELSGRTVEWSSDNPAIAEVDANGVVSAHVPGTATISARSQEVTGVRTLRVVPLRVEIGRDRADLAPGQSVQLAARVLDAAGQPVEGRSVRWTASDPALVEVSATGRVTALRAGNGQVTASVEGGSGVVQVHVYDQYLHLWPDTVASLPGETRQLTIRTIVGGSPPITPDGLTMGAPQVLSGGGAWESSDPSVARVDAEGRVTTVGPGRATITASFGNTRVSSSVHVLSYPQPLRFASLGSASAHSCALTTDGKAYCWGSNENGQLGTRQPSDRCERLSSVLMKNVTASFRTAYRCSLLPLAVETEQRFVSVSVGETRSCAITAAGTAYCWGGGNAVPAVLPGGVAFRSISAATCGVSTRNEAFCWGGTPGSAPVAVPGGVSFVQVAWGSQHSCGVATDGAAWCWGYNYSGELGVSGPLGRCGDWECTVAPVRVDGGHTFRSIVVGAQYTCALDTADQAYCWGSGNRGKLGNGQEQNSRTPVAVAPPNTFTSLVMSSGMACGLGKEGGTFCWGNYFLRTDNSQPIYTSVPVRRLPEAALRSISMSSEVRLCGIGQDGITYCWGRGLDGRVAGQ
ncbi:MAG TPA: Ig-like domain-containing protein [Longimicrobium sp.]|jgi:alpha-tubulin suppressor-like RCC1 family protein